MIERLDLTDLPEAKLAEGATRSSSEAQLTKIAPPTVERIVVKRAAMPLSELAEMLGHETSNAVGTLVGKGGHGKGAKLHRHNGHVVANYDNAKRMLGYMDDAGLADLCERNGITIEEFKTKLLSLPRA